MSEIKEKNKLSSALSIVILLLDLCALAGIIFCFFDVKEKPLIVTNIVLTLLWLAVVVYGVSAYRKPHGNLMRYVILLFAFVLSTEIFVNQGISKVCLALTLTACVLTAYTAGRLGNRTEAVILFAAVAALLIGVAVAERFAPPPRGIMNEPALLGVPGSAGTPSAPAVAPEGEGGKPALITFNLSRVFLWVTIGFTYFVRYAPHREAGKQN